MAFMHVQLVKFYHTNWRSDYEIPTGFAVEPPLGIASLKAYIQSKNITCNTNVFYLSGEISSLITETVQKESKSNIQGILESYKKNENLYKSIIYYSKKILELKPAVIGFSLYEDDYLMSLLVASFLKDLMPQLKIVCGGPQWGNLTQVKNVMLDFPFIDAVIVGEGEIGFKQYIDSLNGDFTGPISSSIIRENGNIIENKVQIQVKMDDLPFPDFSDFKETFFSSSKSTAALSLTRGCIARCRFCSEVNYWRTFRKLSPDKVIELLQHMNSKYGIRKFNFVDSLINGDLNWLKEVATKVVEKKLEIEWYSMCRVDPRMDSALISLLSKSGCKELYLGVESYSQKTLNGMRKGVISENIEPFIERLHQAGINVQPMYMFGYPDESIEDALLTIKHLKRVADLCSGILVQRFYLQRNSNLQETLNHNALSSTSIDDAVYIDCSYLALENDLFVNIFGNTGYYNFNKYPESRQQFREDLITFELGLNNKNISSTQREPSKC